MCRSPVSRKKLRVCRTYLLNIGGKDTGPYDEKKGKRKKGHLVSSFLCDENLWDLFGIQWISLGVPFVSILVFCLLLGLQVRSHFTSLFDTREVCCLTMSRCFSRLMSVCVVVPTKGLFHCASFFSFFVFFCMTY